MRSTRHPSGEPASVPEQHVPLPAEPDARAAAFFDVDNTIMIGASIYHFAKGMAARKVISWRDLAGFGARQIRLRMRGENHRDLNRTRDSALAFVAGKRVADIVALGEQIYDEEMADRIWPGSRALARLHLDAGQRVWLVTATPVELATIIARRLELTGALGTVAESIDGAYTGRLVGDVLHGQAKADAVRALAEREGLDLSRCTAYSDSINDLALLRAVGRAVAVNPDSALRAEARRQGWPVRDFRTGRKAARVGIPGAVGVGALAGGVAAAVSRRAATRSHRQWWQRSSPGRRGGRRTRRDPVLRRYAPWPRPRPRRPAANLAALVPRARQRLAERWSAIPMARRYAAARRA